MKNISKILVTLFIACFALGFSACSDDDGYSYDQYWVEIATITPLNNGSAEYYLVLDDGTKLLPVNQESLLTPKHSRAQVNYTKLSDETGEYKHTVRINYVKYILTKDISELTAENNETLGNDTVKILEYWEGDDYLNIHFGYNMENNLIRHSIHLVEDKSEISQDGTITLEFRHNSNGDSEKYGVTGLAAFNLRPYKIEGRDSVKFKIKVNSFDEIEEHIFVYKYTDTKKSERILPYEYSGGMYE